MCWILGGVSGLRKWLVALWLIPSFVLVSKVVADEKEFSLVLWLDNTVKSSQPVFMLSLFLTHTPIWIIYSCRLPVFHYYFQRPKKGLLKHLHFYFTYIMMMMMMLCAKTRFSPLQCSHGNSNLCQISERHWVHEKNCCFHLVSLMLTKKIFLNKNKCIRFTLFLIFLVGILLIAI